jgi:hypothetical protein
LGRRADAGLGTSILTFTGASSIAMTGVGADRGVRAGFDVGADFDVRAGFDVGADFDVRAGFDVGAGFDVRARAVGLAPSAVAEVRRGRGLLDPAAPTSTGSASGSVPASSSGPASIASDPMPGS